MTKSLQSKLIAENLFKMIVESVNQPTAERQSAEDATRHSTWMEDKQGDLAAKAASQAALILQEVADHMPADSSWAVGVAHELQRHVF